MSKTSKAANLVFQSIFVLNSVKHKFFYVSIVNLIANFINIIRYKKQISNKSPQIFIDKFDISVKYAVKRGTHLMFNAIRAL